MKKFVIVIAACIVGGSFIFITIIPATFYFSMTSTVMKKLSPDKQHVAKLVRIKGIDVNFRVIVDGSQIYSSPDFAPMRADFREQIIWDTNSQIIVLEVADARIFGYHVGEKRPLSDSELLKLQFVAFEELRYEGTSLKGISEK